MSEIKNKKLKKLLKSKSRVKIEKNPDLIINEMKDSEIYVPVITMGDDDENLSENDTLDMQIGYFDEENGDRNIYLFTDVGEIEKSGYLLKAIVVNVGELARILSTFDAEFNYIVLNPYSDLPYKIEFNEFLEKLN